MNDKHTWLWIVILWLSINQIFSCVSSRDEKHLEYKISDLQNKMQNMEVEHSRKIFDLERELSTTRYNVNWLVGEHNRDRMRNPQ